MGITMRKDFEYVVFDANHEYICQGSSTDVSRQLNIKLCSFYGILRDRGKHVHNKYYVKKIYPRFKIYFIQKGIRNFVFDGDKKQCIDFLCINEQSFMNKLHTQDKTKHNQYYVEKYFPRHEQTKK